MKRTHGTQQENKIFDYRSNVIHNQHHKSQFSYFNIQKAIYNWTKRLAAYQKEIGDLELKVLNRTAMTKNGKRNSLSKSSNGV